MARPDRWDAVYETESADGIEVVGVVETGVLGPELVGGTPPAGSWVVGPEFGKVLPDGVFGGGGGGVTGGVVGGGAACGEQEVSPATFPAQSCASTCLAAAAASVRSFGVRAKYPSGSCPAWWPYVCPDVDIHEIIWAYRPARVFVSPCVGAAAYTGIIPGYASADVLFRFADSVPVLLS